MKKDSNHSPIPSAALDDRLGFVGTAGSGKTYNAGGCIERLLDVGARVVIIDPLDVWWGLRLIADGKSSSRYQLPIFGGSHADLPLSENAGALIGETVAGMAESCIVSLGGLPTKASERRFMLAFLDAIYRKANGEPVHLIFDEADLWAPQKSSEPMLQSRMEEICRRGRVKGLIPWLITQRPAVISKDVLSQVDGLIAFKLTSSQDRDALEGWIEGQADRAAWKEIRAKLPTMERGQGVVWLPGRGILETAKFPQKRTFDSSRTPKRGEAKRTASLKPLDLGALKARLATVETETKENDPKALKARIAEMERLTKTASGAVARVDSSAIESAAYARGRNDGYAHAVAGIAAECKGITAALSSALTALNNAQAAVAQIIHWSGQKPPKATLPAENPQRVSEIRRFEPMKLSASTNGRTGPEQRILDAIRWWNVMGVLEPSHPQVAFIAGYSHKSGTWATYLSRLRSEGLIEGRGNLILTASAVTNDPTTIPNGETLRSVVAAKIDAPLQRILKPIMDAYPQGISHEAAGKASGYSHTSGTWATYLSRMRTLDLIDGRGELKAKDWLFP